VFILTVFYTGLFVVLFSILTPFNIVRPLFQKNFYKLNSEAGTLFENYFDEMEARTSDLSTADFSGTH